MYLKSRLLRTHQHFSGWMCVSSQVSLDSSWVSGLKFYRCPQWDITGRVMVHNSLKKSSDMLVLLRDFFLVARPIAVSL